MYNIATVTDICLHVLTKYNDVKPLYSGTMPNITINGISKSSINLISIATPIDEDLEKHLIRPAVALMAVSDQMTAYNYLLDTTPEIKLFTGASPVMDLGNTTTVFNRWKAVALEILSYCFITWIDSGTTYKLADFISPDISSTTLNDVKSHVQSWLNTVNITDLMKTQTVGCGVTATSLLFGYNDYLKNIIETTDKVNTHESEITTLQSDVIILTNAVDQLNNTVLTLTALVNNMAPTNGLWIRIIAIIGGAAISKQFGANPIIGAVIGFLVSKIA